MISIFNKKLLTCTVTALSLVLMVGCSNTTKPISNSTNTDENSTKSSTSSTVKPNVTNSNSSQTNPTIKSSSSSQKPTTISSSNSQSALLTAIMKLAKEGKVINCEIAVDSMVIDDIETKWGASDKTDYVAAAKGSYATYSKQNVVFGFNKGSRIFEVRSMDKSLGKISLSMAKKAFGIPPYDVKSKGQEIIGYIATKDYKVLLVFPQATSINKDPLMDHYSVIKPSMTANNMAGYPAREW